MFSVFVRSRMARQGAEASEPTGRMLLQEALSGWVDLRVGSVGSLKGLPKTLTLQTKANSTVGDVRERLTELTGDHRARAGLVLGGRKLSSSEDDREIGSLLERKARLLVYDEIDGKDNPLLFFPPPRARL